jgi:hypothetical protein
MPKNKKKKAKKKLSAAEKLALRIRRKFHRDFRTFFRNIGFSRVAVDGKEIVVDGRTGELDDIFVFHNVLILVEYTTGKVDSAHVLKKKPFFDKIGADIPSFLQVSVQNQGQQKFLDN